MAGHLGFTKVLTSVGQVYPRSHDFDVVSALVQAIVKPAKSSLPTIRLMAGLELVTEGFQAGQVGSSAMPHKMNTRSCERINGLAVVLRGHLSMVGELVGDQWNEGDVSCLLVVRRVALPDAFFATDGLFETFLTVLDEFGVFPAVVAARLDAPPLPFLATMTKVLLAAVRQGVGRETAHEAIKEHAVAVALEMREKGAAENDLFARLAADDRLELSAGRPAQPWWRSRSPAQWCTVDQVDAVVVRVERLVADNPAAAAYRPAAILFDRPAESAPTLATRQDRSNDESSQTPGHRLDCAQGAQHLYSGKVRDLYELPDGSLLMVATDRLSAFDFVLESTIPDKGEILTRMTLWWFSQIADLVPNHVVSDRRLRRSRWPDALSICERLEMYPVECVVRGYLHRLLARSTTGWLARDRAAMRPARRARGRVAAARADLHPGHEGAARLA